MGIHGLVELRVRLCGLEGTVPSRRKNGIAITATERTGTTRDLRDSGRDGTKQHALSDRIGPGGTTLSRETGIREEQSERGSLSIHSVLRNERRRERDT